MEDILISEARLLIGTLRGRHVIASWTEDGQEHDILVGLKELSSFVYGGSGGEHRLYPFMESRSASANPAPRQGSTDVTMAASLHEKAETNSNLTAAAEHLNRVGSASSLSSSSTADAKGRKHSAPKSLSEGNNSTSDASSTNPQRKSEKGKPTEAPAKEIKGKIAENNPLSDATILDASGLSEDTIISGKKLPSKKPSEKDNVSKEGEESASQELEAADLKLSELRMDLADDSLDSSGSETPVDPGSTNPQRSQFRTPPLPSYANRAGSFSANQSPFLLSPSRAGSQMVRHASVDPSVLMQQGALDTASSNIASYNRYDLSPGSDFLHKLDLALALQPFLDLLSADVVPIQIKIDTLGSLRRILAHSKYRAKSWYNISNALLSVADCVTSDNLTKEGNSYKVHVATLIAAMFSSDFHLNLSDGEIVYLLEIMIRLVFDFRNDFHLRSIAHNSLIDIVERLLEDRNLAEHEIFDVHYADFQAEIRKIISARALHAFLFPDLDTLFVTGKKMDRGTSNPSSKRPIGQTPEILLELSAALSSEPPEQNHCEPSQVKKILLLRRTELPLIILTLFAAAAFDPLVKCSSIDRYTALQILIHIVRSGTRNGMVHKLDPTIRKILNTEAIPAVLRILCFPRVSTHVTSVTFDLATSLVFGFMGYHRGLLAALIERVFPLYISGTFPSGEIMSGTQREIGLEALRNLLLREDMFSIMYSSFDCNPVCEYGLKSLMMELSMFTPFKEKVKPEDMASLKEIRAAYLLRSEIILGPLLVLASRERRMSRDISKHRLTPSTSVKPLEISISGAASVTPVHLKTQTVSELRRLRECKALLIREIHSFLQVGKFTAERLSEILCHQSIQHALFPGKMFDEPRSLQLAQFLRTTQFLDKKTIGAILGEHDAFTIETLNHFAGLFDFKDIDLVSALRLYLESFYLPGEGQKIDRIVHAFAKHYFDVNQKNAELSVYRSSDAVYVMSYSVIMLNTDKHNSMVKRKMSAAEFISNNRGMNDGVDFPREYLESVYNGIEKGEIKMNEDSTMSDRAYDWASFLQLEQNSTPLIIPAEGGQIDTEIFEDHWRYFVQASNLMLSEIKNPDALHGIIGDFFTIMRCSVEFNVEGPVDAIIQCLANASLLFQGSLPSLFYTVGNSVEAQMAIVALFRVAREYHDYIRVDGWNVILSASLRLHALGILPLLIDAFEPVLPQSKAEEAIRKSSSLPWWWPAYVPHERREDLLRLMKRAETMEQSARLSTFMTSVFGIRPDEPPKWNESLPSFLKYGENMRPETFVLVESCIRDCRIREILVQETRFISNASLNALLGTLSNTINLLQRELQTGRFGPLSRLVLYGGGVHGLADSWMNAASRYVPMPRSIPNEKISTDTIQHTRTDEEALSYILCSFCIDLVTEITIQNKDRLSVVWPLCNDILDHVFSMGKATTPIVSRATVSVFKLILRLLNRAEVEEELLKTLMLILQFPPAVTSDLSPIIVAGLYQTVKLYGSQIKSSLGWSAILSLIDMTSRWNEASNLIGLECLYMIVTLKSFPFLFEKSNFNLALDAIYSFGSKDPKFAANAIPCLNVLSVRLPGEIPREMARDKLNDDEIETQWKLYWHPIFNVYKLLVTNQDSQIAQLAVDGMASILLGNESGGHMNKPPPTTGEDGNADVFALTDGIILLPHEYAELFRGYLLQMIRKLLLADPVDPITVSKMVDFTARLFLENHQSVYEDLGKLEWSSLWLSLLQAMQSVLDWVDAKITDKEVQNGMKTGIYKWLNDLLRSSQENQILDEKIDPALWKQTTKILYHQQAPAGGEASV